MTDSDQPRPSDDLATADRKSRSVDERIAIRQDSDAIPAVELEGPFAANIPQGGIGAAGPVDVDLGPGEVALDRERKAQETPTRHG